MRSRRRAALTAAALAAAVYACSGLLERAPQLPRIEGAEAVGSSTCVDCHDDVADGFGVAAHTAMVSQRQDACETCHGFGSKHVESVDVADILGKESLRALSATQRSQVCLECHSSDVGRFWSTQHADAGVSCWDCHSHAFHQLPEPPAEAGAEDPYGDSIWGRVEPPDLAPGRVTSLSRPRPGSDGAEFCYQCHTDVRGSFELQYHHPVPEGRMECADCHSVHGRSPLRIGDGTGRAAHVVSAHRIDDDGSGNCVTCHSEIAGPWVFEHLALENGCLPCHTPHGSTVDKLLRQYGNSMCEQCHFDARYPLIGAVDHTRLLSGGALCVDCHFQVHGSNTDENLAPLRIGETLRGGAR